MPRTLKHRETQILKLIADGQNAPAIADRLSLSTETVRWYIKQLYRELGVNSRAEAVRIAMSRGLLDAPVASPASSSVVSDIRYTSNRGVHIAYRTIGDGPIDLLFIHGFVSHLDIAMEQPEYVEFFGRLARHARVILFDKRGVGVSDRDRGPSTIEDTVSDARCVLAAVGSKRTFVFGTSEGGAAAVMLASMMPEYVQGLILFAVSPFVGGHGAEFPWSADNADQARRADPIPARWGEPWALERFAPSRAGVAHFRAWWSRLLRAATSPSVVATLLANSRAVDIRALLPSIETPTLVIHRTDDRLVPLAAARYLAEHLPNARLVELPGEDHVWFIDGEPLAQVIADYVQQPGAAVDVRTWIAIILCTSGAGAALDAEKRAILEAHGARSLRESDAAWTALFDGPTAAIRCARQLRARGAGRTGGIALHVGACTVSGGAPVGATYARVLEASQAADAGVILITSTLRDILAGTDVPMVAHSIVADERSGSATTVWMLTS